MKHPVRFAALGLFLALSGCGANGLPPVSGISNDGSAPGGAYASVSSDTKDAGMPGPYGEPQTATAAREVIANPTIADVMAPSPLPEMSWGRPDAPVTIVQYASLTCPHCRNFHMTVFPELKKSFIDTGKVRYILREFPIGKQSGVATVALRCATPEKYLDLYGRFMDQQGAWVSQDVRPDPIFAIAQQVGMTRPQFDACLSNQGMIENLKWVKERGRKLGIIGTPNYFVGNELVKKELTIADIRAYVDTPPAARAAASAAAPAPR